jgi:DNA polymerase (family 10)
MRTIDLLPRAKLAQQKLVSDPRVLRTEIAGSIRRGRDDVGDLDLVIATPDPWDFYRAPQRASQRDKTTYADVFVASPVQFGATLVFATGPRLLNFRLREIAQSKGLIFDYRSQWSNVFPQFGPFIGLYLPDGTPIPAPDEETFFSLLAVPFVPPTEREALAISLPGQPILLGDKGQLCLQ